MTVLQEPVQVGASRHIVVITRGGGGRVFTEPASTAASVRAEAAWSPPQASQSAAHSPELSSVFSRFSDTVVVPG